MVGVFATAMLAASLAGSYDCTLGRQVVITESGADNMPVSFPGADRDAWRFGVTVPEGDMPEVVIDWPADPIQISGSHAPIAVAPGQVALAALSAGPCMFTEQDCLALVQLSAREDGSASISVLPAGSVRDENGARTLLHVVFLGTCQRRDGAERR